tara:strand:+ start:192 stop:581 length:390 start_codon:yes stop_codon:yes gene_type:complete
MEAQKEVLYNSNMHFEHQQWNRELIFWQDELKSFNSRLSELVTGWNDEQAVAQLEYYQNQFVLHRGFIEDLIEVIEKHEISAADQTKTGTVLQNVLAKKHIELRNGMDSQRYKYAELKKEFFRFLSKYM